MSNEELMQPRYKVIAGYPYSVWSVGDILSSEYNDEWFGIPDKEEYDRSSIHINIITHSPNIFKKLEWWEDRKPEDMPKYVKQIYTGQIAKTEWDKWGGCFFAKGIATPFNSQIYLLPSSESEYNEYRLLNP